MTATYYIATQGRRIFKITGPPDAPIATESAQIGTQGQFYNVASADGQDVWAGGSGLFADDTALWRSQDGGGVWADAGGLLPDPDYVITALFALANDLVYCGGNQVDPDHPITLWDGSTWTNQGPGVANRATGQIWASPSSDDIYAVCSSGTGRLYWYNGALWQYDASIASGHVLEAIYGVSPSEIYWWKNTAPAGVYKGVYGAWVLDLPKGAGWSCWATSGNALWCSPCGDVYLSVGDGAQSHVWKKPVGGVWGHVFTCSGAVGVAGGIHGVSDTDLLACCADYFYRSDGTNWWEYKITDLGLTPSSALRGVWGWKPLFEVTAVDKTTISTVGGEAIMATGKFPTDSVMQAYLGPLGTSEDPPCYGGLGLGYDILSLDGTTVQFATPPLAKGDVGLTIIWGSNTVTLAVGAIHVVERSWPSKMHRVRGNFAPWKALGARRLDEEGPE